MVHDYRRAVALRLVRKLEVTTPAVRPAFRAAVIQGCRSGLRDRQ